jgi:hypothetical protein
MFGEPDFGVRRGSGDQPHFERWTVDNEVYASSVSDIG